MSKVSWSYAVTTIPERKDTTLRITCASLAKSGFTSPHLFIDGVKHGDVARNWMNLHLPITSRPERIGTYGAWILALWELFLRNPVCDRYAIFQDDFICCSNLRTYLDKTLFPHPSSGISHNSNHCYYNLITQLRNEVYVRGKPIGWLESESTNTPQRLQYGKGAVALVFNREGVMTLLSSRHLVDRIITADTAKIRKNVDGAVVTAMNYAGWREYIHNPSLIGHIGYNSITSPGKTHSSTLLFPGEDHDPCY